MNQMIRKTTLSAVEAAQHIGCSRSYFYAYVKPDLLHEVRLPGKKGKERVRYRLWEVDDWIEKHTREIVHV